MNISVTSLGLNTTSKTKNYKINFKKISTNQLGIFKDNCANNHNNFAYSFDAGFDLVVNLAKSLKSVLDKIPKDYSLQDKLNALLYKEISEYSLYDSGNSFYIKDGQICSYRNSNGDDILYIC